GYHRIVGVRLPHRRQPGIARIYRPSRAGPYTQAKDGGSSLRGRRQGPRRADCTEVIGLLPSRQTTPARRSSFIEIVSYGTVVTMVYAANAVTPDRQRA